MRCGARGTLIILFQWQAIFDPVVIVMHDRGWRMEGVEQTTEISDMKELLDIMAIFGL